MPIPIPVAGFLPALSTVSVTRRDEPTVGTPSTETPVTVGPAGADAGDGVLASPG